jgi:hypothetical protein
MRVPSRGTGGLWRSGSSGPHDMAPVREDGSSLHARVGSSWVHGSGLGRLPVLGPDRWQAVRSKRFQPFTFCKYPGPRVQGNHVLVPHGLNGLASSLETEGFTQCRRWLIEATRPAIDLHDTPHPGGLPQGVCSRRWHPCRDAGTLVRVALRWCRRFAPQPPATLCEASGFMTVGPRGHFG